MLKVLVSRYGLREFDFLRKASSPKLEALGVSSLVPSESEMDKGLDAKLSTPPPEQNGSQVTRSRYVTRGEGTFYCCSKIAPCPE